MDVSPRVNDLHARFCGAITHRYFIRVHMSVMLALVLLSGVVAGSAMRRAGISHMGVRYPIAVLFSYAVFLGLVRLWVAYVCSVSGFAPRRVERAGGSGSSGGGLLDDAFGSSGSSGGASEGFSGGGGSSGGAGSSGSFGDAAGTAPRASNPLSFFSSGKGGGHGGGGGGKSGGGGGGDGDGLLLLILFALLVVAVFGAGAYLVYQAPVILSETAFHALLAGGLVRTARGAHEPGWMGSALKATVLPFALVLVLAGVFGYQAHKLCPTASTVGQVFHNCIW
ncbi:MAG: hypothetical protein ABI682_11395 [Acidobacteriota bacterium]